MMVSDQFLLPKAPRHILIIQLGDIGDVVWTVPTLLSVRDAYPRAMLSVLVREGSGALLEAEPYLSKIFQVRSYSGGFFEKARGQVRFISDLRREHFDLVVDLRTGDRGALMARLTGAPVRAALLSANASRWRNGMFTHLVRPVNENVRLTYGAAEQSLRIVRGLGIATKTTIPVLHVSPQAMTSVRALLARLDPEWYSVANPREAMITLNPFSRWSYKEWKLEKWIPVTQWLSGELKCRIVLIGSASEKSKAAVLERACPGAVLNAAGETTLAELAALLSRSRLHIGVDSAAPHIAAAVGTPTMTLYGPSDWRDWAPVGEQHRVICPDEPCSPCHRKGCDGQGYSRCLDQLSVETVKSVIWTAVSPLQST